MIRPGRRQVGDFYLGEVTNAGKMPALHEEPCSQITFAGRRRRGRRPSLPRRL